MAKVIYKPEADMPESTEQYGYSFERAKGVEVTDAQHLRKFGGNRFFKVIETLKTGDDQLKSHNL